jgi:AcrR family transcriptional regulator
MSGKKTALKTKLKLTRDPKAKMDRRERRTRDALGDALIELMHEKPFEGITVQHVLDRAGIGRSTFYAHYRGKDDLFVSDVDEFWEMMSTLVTRRGEVSDRVVPVGELFSHIAEVEQFRSALLSSGKMHDVMELGQAHFARAIEQRLAQDPRSKAIAVVRRQAMAHALAGALFSMLMWWIDHKMPSSPAEMDATFHEMVWSSVRAAVAQSDTKADRATSISKSSLGKRPMR